jgi:hypothetical protein
MPGVVPKFETGPKTYEAKSNITGGQCVEYATGTPTQPDASLVQPATANSIKFAGVATRDAVAAANQAALQTFTSGDGYPAINVAVPTELVAVGKRGQWPLKYAAAAVYGDRVKCAATGQVTPWVVGTDTDPTLIIGRCEEQAGVASGAVGQTWID